MRICIVSQFAYGVNVSPRLYQAALLSKRGHEIFFVTPKQQYMLHSNQKSGTPQVEDFHGVKMSYFNVAYPIPSLAYPLPDIVEETKLISHIIRQKKVDIVHFYQPEFLTSIPLPLIKKHGRPILLTINGFPGISWHYGTAMVDSVGLAYTLTIVRSLIKYANKLLLYASNLKLFAKRLGVAEDKMVYLPEGIQLDLPRNTKEIRETTRNELGISDGEKLIIFIGRLVPVKGVNTLIEAFKKLNKEYSNCKLLIVGDGPCRKTYEEQSGNLLNKAITFTGLVKPEKVVRFLLASDIFVLPSLSEGIPSSILEACYCGLPCIATSTGATSDIIKDSETGILIKQDDERNLWQALIRLTTDGRMAKRLGENAQARVKRIFNWNKIIEIYEQTCIDLIEKRTN